MKIKSTMGKALAGLCMLVVAEQNVLADEVKMPDTCKYGVVNAYQVMKPRFETVYERIGLGGRGPGVTYATYSWFQPELYKKVQHVVDLIPERHLVCKTKTGGIVDFVLQNGQYISEHEIDKKFPEKKHEKHMKKYEWG